MGRKTTRRLIFFLVLSISMAGFLWSQEKSDEHQLFGTDSVFEMTLVMDIDSLLAHPDEAPEYQHAVLAYPDPQNGQEVKLNINVRARGSFRRNPENCDFPPLKLKFEKSEREGSIFEELKEIKIVTHCQSQLPEFEQYVLQEYLIYKAYNIYTSFSFNVRLARINYVNTSGADTITRFAFLIEDPEHMAERNQGTLIELETVPGDRLNQELFTLMSMFNYMMLNTDYSVPIAHNVELISTEYFSPPIPVPYDFDWSGIINIPYESPYAGSKSRYTGRQYKGPCLKRKEFELTFSGMLAKREELTRLYRDFPYMDEELKSRTLQDLNMFFIIIGSRELVRQEFIKNCD